jgi:hypothetical protein
MTRIRFDPAVPLDIEVSFDSPQVAACVLWQRPPGGEWQLFAKLTDEESVALTAHRYRLTDVADGTGLRYRFLFIGNANTAIEAHVRLAQDGRTLRHGHVEIGGSTDEDGVAVRRGEVTLHES